MNEHPKGWLVREALRASAKRTGLAHYSDPASSLGLLPQTSRPHTAAVSFFLLLLLLFSWPPNPANRQPPHRRTARVAMGRSRWEFSLKPFRTKAHVKALWLTRFPHKAQGRERGGRGWRGGVAVRSSTKQAKKKRKANIRRKRANRPAQAHILTRAF